ncbi:MAG: hypothetical protein A2Y67_00675 [Candidatus Buchananbacteria bacterium RBG_13_39_9]|uniref:Uncharacterized protein n=1 Tax=Candidatus Buchananbacteria bacterium RBG_13_39_9 TaxID=1797531 RepID=A0A1G1XMB3_9BACT|nr:MAG: hypothetical protein A2Y67_00675 [Candidatus Buchananbacteria bacterium RBG_13_39_9]
MIKKEVLMKKKIKKNVDEEVLKGRMEKLHVQRAELISRFYKVLSEAGWKNNRAEQLFNAIISLSSVDLLFGDSIITEGVWTENRFRSYGLNKKTSGKVARLVNLIIKKELAIKKCQSSS